MAIIKLKNGETFTVKASRYHIIKTIGAVNGRCLFIPLTVISKCSSGGEVKEEEIYQNVDEISQILKDK